MDAIVSENRCHESPFRSDVVAKARSEGRKFGSVAEGDPPSPSSSTVFDAIKHLCGRTIVFNGETYDTYSEEHLLLKLTWWAAEYEGWYAIAGNYLGAGYYDVLFADSGGVLMRRIEGHGQ